MNLEQRDTSARAADRIPEVEDGIARRSQWLLSHPAELAWEADLATRLAQYSKEPGGTSPGHDAQPDHDLEALFRSIDLRTIDLSAHLPRAAIQRATSRALGLSNRGGRADIALPPLPATASTPAPTWASSGGGNRPVAPPGRWAGRAGENVLYLEIKASLAARTG